MFEMVCAFSPRKFKRGINVNENEIYLFIILLDVNIIGFVCRSGGGGRRRG